MYHQCSLHVSRAKLIGWNELQLEGMSEFVAQHRPPSRFMPGSNIIAGAEPESVRW